MYHRAILHMDLDAFFVSVECIKNSQLQGLPLIVGGYSSRGVVAACSYEARAFGVHSAMPMKMALRLCPQATVIRGDMDSYTKYSAMVTDIIAEQAPVFEKASIDEFYLDLTGMDRYFGCMKWAVELREKLMREAGLPISFGLSVNKLVSKIGTGEAKPNGMLQVASGEEREFLSPLSTSKIPGIGKQTYKRLSFMGVRFIHTLRDIPVPLLQREFGNESGKSLWEHANAIDETAVVPYHEQKSISKETTFEKDTLDIRRIRILLLDMCEKLAFELRQGGRVCCCVTVKIRYADFNTYSKQRRIAYTAHDDTLRRVSYELFDALYEKRQLIRLVGLKFSGLVQGHYQISLFEDTAEQISLMQQLDHIRRRWGAGSVMRAAVLK
ncbi:MAG: DNA polymerase IV [Saprospiraceae bacterium]|nr:DNA polymerase IV [Saprospiraceae bacterium]